VLAPDLSMHTALDVSEPEHAGNWRGLYDHKNGAGSIMAIFVFLGLFCRRVGYPVLGTTLALASAVFLAFTFAKSSTMLMPAVLVLSWLCTLSAATWWRAALVIGPLALLLAGTLGTLLVPFVETIVATVLNDASFTGRTEIWQFALDNIAKRPLTGYGYGAFWESVFYGGGGEGTSWVNAIKSAHNGYLSVALDIGLPGLALTLWWYVLAPLRDLQSHAGGREIDPLALLFLRIWLFVLLLTVFETNLYVPTNGLSFFIAVAVFGLRYRAGHPVIAGTPPGRAGP
jgi:O-antigen ligase